MNFRTLNWPIGIGLGAFALVRPLVRIVEDQLGVDWGAAVPIGATVAISLVWIAVVGLTRCAEPVFTLLVSGVTYGIASIVLSGVLSPILEGQFMGPLANPIAIVPVLLLNAAWGLAAGFLAMLLQRVRGVRSGGDRSNSDRPNSDLVSRPRRR